jgi:hypothetical protein
MAVNGASPPPAKPWAMAIKLNAEYSKMAFRNDDYSFMKIIHATPRATTDALVKLSPLFAEADSSSSVDPVDQNALNNISVATLGSLKSHSDNFTAQTTAMKDDKNPSKDDWTAKIRQNAADLKKKNDDAVDAAADQAIAKINDMPGPSQDAAANIFIMGTNIVNGFVQKIRDFAVNILNSVMDFLKGIWDKLVCILSSDYRC